MKNITENLPNAIEQAPKITFEDLQNRLEESMRNLDVLLEKIKENHGEGDIAGKATLLVDFKGQVTGQHPMGYTEWTDGTVGEMWVSPTEGAKVHLNVHLGVVPIIRINNSNEVLLDVVTPQEFYSHEELQKILKTRVGKLFEELQSILNNNVIQNNKEMHDGESHEEFYDRKIKKLLRIVIDCDVNIEGHSEGGASAKILHQSYGEQVNGTGE